MGFIYSLSVDLIKVVYEQFMLAKIYKILVAKAFIQFHV